MSQKVTVFKIKGKTEEFLKDLIKRQDNTHGPMGSGGYEVREKTSREFIFTQCDVAPAESFYVKVKDNEIYAKEVADFILRILARSELKFTTKQIDPFELPDFHD